MNMEIDIDLDWYEESKKHLNARPYMVYDRVNRRIWSKKKWPSAQTAKADVSIALAADARRVTGSWVSARGLYAKQNNLVVIYVPLDFTRARVA